MRDINYDEINIEELKDDLKNEFGAAAFSGFPVAMMEVFDLDNATDEEIVSKALSMGYDIDKYRLDRYVK